MEQVAEAEHLPGFVVFKLNVETVFYADLHLDAVVGLWGHFVGMNPELLLLNEVRQPPCHGDANDVPVGSIDQFLVLSTHQNLEQTAVSH